MPEVGSELHKLVTITFQSSDQFRSWFAHDSCGYFSKYPSVICYFTSSMWSSEESDANGVLVNGLVPVFDSRKKERLSHHYQLQAPMLFLKQQLTCFTIIPPSE